ncbi:MAG TPA: hypothetical protein VMU28_12735 [Terriglobales bacterium]|nr:hypothetical protein [Terriglobales bacterium]
MKNHVTTGLDNLPKLDPPVFEVPPDRVGIDEGGHIVGGAVRLVTDDPKDLKNRNWLTLRDQLLDIRKDDEYVRQDAAEFLQHAGYRARVGDDWQAGPWTAKQVTYEILETLREWQSFTSTLLFGRYARLRGDALQRYLKLLKITGMTPQAERFYLGVGDAINIPAHFRFADGKPKTYVRLQHALEAIILLTHYERSLGSVYRTCILKGCGKRFKAHPRNQLGCCKEHTNAARQQRFRKEHR